MGQESQESGSVSADSTAPNRHTMAPYKWAWLVMREWSMADRVGTIPQTIGRLGKKDRQQFRNDDASTTNGTA